jgi:hypothetical protein
MAQLTKQPTSTYNPFFGCAIMSMAAIMFIGIVAWSLYSLLKQDSEIAKFTVEQAVPLSNPVLSDDARNALLIRAKAFADAAQANKPATLELSIIDVNALIDAAPDSGYGSFRNMVVFTSTKPADNSLTANVCLPLNKARFWEGKRYAVGEALFKLEQSAEGPDVRLTSLNVPGKVVSEGFIGAFAGWRWVTPYQKIEPVGSVLKGIKNITVTSTGLTLSTTK